VHINLALALRELGAGFNLPQTQAVYAPLLASQPREGVRLMADCRYGPHPRHTVDIYRPEHDGDHPVLVWLHGGGFIRGDKAQRANIGWWGAREGFVTLIPNYRLAPESPWPSGAEDVVALWRWLWSPDVAFTCKPERLVLAGESAGAAHVAAASLLRRFQPMDWRIAGAALFSGPYDAGLEGLAATQFGIATPDPRNEAYFGEERLAWRAASIVDHVDAAPFPLSIAFAERDLLQMQVQASTLFARLVKDLNFTPELRVLADHNHFSPGFSIGTEDTSVSDLLADFVRRACA
jgi:acetyl esterase